MKRVNKISVLVMVAVAVLLVSGCSKKDTAQGSTAQPRVEKDRIAVCLQQLDNPLMLGIADAMVKAFPEQNVEVASANGDPNTQATQIQNYITMGAKMIVTMPVEASSLGTVLKEARAKGIKIIVNGTKMEDGTYDAMATVNQYLVGQYSAVMAKEWIDKTYPNAQAGSVETALLISSLNEDSIAKSNGLRSITELYRKNAAGEYIDADNNVVDEAHRLPNPVYCPQVKVVETPEAEMFQAAQVATENVLTKHPNIKLVICSTSDGASGASQVFMDRGFTEAELDKIATFGCGLIGPEEANLIEASTGGGVFRGAIAFGGADLPGEMAALSMKVYFNEPYEADVWDPIAKVYAVNGEITRIRVNNVGAVQTN